MADRYWVGGTASWDATAGTKWALTSGGAGGQSVPTSSDDVFFDAASGAATVTVSTGNTGAKSINCTGFTGTLTGSGAITVSGSVTLVTGMTVTYTGTLTLNGTGTLTSAGKILGPVAINGAGITVTLGDALNIGASTFSVSQGTFTTSASSYSLTVGIFSGSGTSARSILLNGSTVNASNDFSFATNTNLTFNAGTSTINLSKTTGTSLQGGATSNVGVTFYNVNFTSVSAGITHQIGGINTFNNLTVTASSSVGVTQIMFDSRQTINGTLSTTGTAGNRRVWFRSSTYGIARTLTVNSTPSLTDADFRDVYVIGTAAPVSGIRIGDLRGCSGITFSTPKTVYWNLAAGGNWSATAWAAGSGGAVSDNNFPLAQDTAVIENTGLNTSATVTLNSSFVYLGSLSMSTRTNAMILSISSSQTVYGNWTNGSGTTISGAVNFTFSGRNTQTITSAGKQFNNLAFGIDSYDGTVELADAFISGSGIVVTNGIFDTKSYNVSIPSLESNNSNVRGINLGSSTITISGVSGIVFTSVNFTFNAGTSQINCTSAGVSITAANTFYNLSLTGTSGTPSISGNNTFNNLSVIAPSSVGIRDLSLNGNQIVIETLTCAGATPTRRIFVRSNTIGTPRTLTVGTLVATDCDFRDIVITGTAANSASTRAGNCGGNSGITFPAAKTVYWNLAGTQNWSATAWASTSGGTPNINNFPLAQDIAVFDNTGSVGIVNIDQLWNISTFNASARTTAMTFSTGSVDRHIFYGDFIAGSGVTITSGGALSQFAGDKLQTINMNGISWGAGGIEVIKHPGTTLQLASSLTLVGRALSIATGIFDAVSYNFTSSTFSASASTTTKMGSGTWTLTGTGSIFTIPTSSFFYKGTADIVLSSSSTASRIFSGGDQTFNKLTIGGTTGISTLTITGNNQFTELASTKTVAHTIDFSTTVQTFGKWSVSGTAGNMVTLAGTGTSHIIAGARVSDIDYLAMGFIGFSVISPGEFYAGANSTGIANPPVYRTAAPAARTLYWVGGTGNWTNTARWSALSGGAGGELVPTSADNVVFDSNSNSTGYTVTVDARARLNDFTITNPGWIQGISISGTNALWIHGSFNNLHTNTSWSNSGGVVFAGSTLGKTISTNGISLGSTGGITFNGIGSSWTFGSASGTFVLTLTNGSIDFNGYSFSANSIVSNNTNSRAISFGNSTVTLSINTPLNFGTTENTAANLTINGGTSQINLSGANVTFSGNGKTFYNVKFTDPAPTTITINGKNTFNNLEFGNQFSSMNNVVLTDNQNINGSLIRNLSNSASARVFIRNSLLGTPCILTCNSATVTDVDFRDITIAGAAVPVSGTRLGDCKGNSGITFDAPKTVYRRGLGNDNWSDTNTWSNTSGGTGNDIYFPLAQDTVVFPTSPIPYPGNNTSVTINAAYNIGTIDMSARTTNTMTLATSTNALTIYGNWINGTGTTLTGSGNITFAGRNTQTITSAGKTFTQNIFVTSPSGSVTLQDSLTTNGNLQLVAGTLGTNNFAVNCVTFTSSSASTRLLAMGSSTIIVSSLTGWDSSTSLFSVTGNGTISLTSASAKTFAGGSVSYAGLTLNQGGAGTLTITGNNTFADITNTYSATGATTIALGNTTQRVGKFSASGTAGKVLTVTGTSASSPATLVYTGAGEATAATTDYLNVIGVRAYNLANTWKAGANSTNAGSLGWIFAAATVVATVASTFFLMF